MAAVIEKKWGKGIITRVKIIADTVGGSLRDENGAVFATFATYHKFAAVKVDRVAIERDELGNTQSARE